MRSVISYVIIMRNESFLGSDTEVGGGVQWVCTHPIDVRFSVTRAREEKRPAFVLFICITSAFVQFIPSLANNLTMF